MKNNIIQLATTGTSNYLKYHSTNFGPDLGGGTKGILSIGGSSILDWTSSQVSINQHLSITGTVSLNNNKLFIKEASNTAHFISYYGDFVDGIQIQGDNGVVIGTSSNTSSILIKPTYVTINQDLSLTGSLTAGSTTISNTSLGFISGATSNLQSQLDKISYNNLGPSTTGISNIPIGNTNMNLMTSGNNNIAIGTSALANTTIESNNIAIGVNAGAFLNTNDNIAIGTNTGATGANSFYGSTCIGNGSKITGSNQVVLGTATEKVIVLGTLNVSGTSTLNTSVNGAFIVTQALLPYSGWSGYSSSGLQIGWNNTAGGGRTDFLNNGQGGAGGFEFWITHSTSTTPIKTVTITSAGIYSGAFYATSDYRLKDNITNLDVSLNVDLLRPVKYNLKSDNLEHMGFIAHEVQEVFPSLVDGEKDGVDFQSLNYTGLIPILVLEIQRLKKDIEAIKKLLS
jgi:hypothetical protein